MRVLAQTELSLGKPLHMWRATPLVPLAGGVALLASGCLMPVVIERFGLPRWLWIPSLLLAGVSIQFFLNAWRAQSAGAWVVKWDGRLLALQARSHLKPVNSRSDATLAVFESGEIASLRKRIEKRVVPRIASGSYSLQDPSRRESWKILEVRFRDPSAARELSSLLDREAHRSAGRPGWVRNLHNRIPMWMTEDLVLHIGWRTPRHWLRSSLDKALEVLRGGLPVEEAQIVDCGDWKALDPSDLDAFVTGLGRAGRYLESLAVLQKIGGFDLVEARARLDELLAPSVSPDRFSDISPKGSHTPQAI